MKEEKSASSALGCLVFPAIFLVVGLLLVGIGLYVGDDVTAYNRSNGKSEPIDTTLFVIGGVFAGLGALGSILALVVHKSPKPEVRLNQPPG